MREPKMAFALLVTLMLFTGMMAAAAVVGGPDPLPGQPPASKIIVSGSLIADPDLLYSTKPLTMGTKIVINAPYPAPGETYDVLMRGGNFFDSSIAFMFMTMWGGDQLMGQTAIPGLFSAKDHRASVHIGVGTNPGLITMDLVERPEASVPSRRDGHGRRRRLDSSGCASGARQHDRHTRQVRDHELEAGHHGRV
jgi:hypothetical protein